MTEHKKTSPHITIYVEFLFFRILSVILHCTTVIKLLHKPINLIINVFLNIEMSKGKNKQCSVMYSLICVNKLYGKDVAGMLFM